MSGLFKSGTVFLVLLFTVMGDAGYAVVSADFARYDIILNRKPFGEPPAKPAIAQPPATNPPTPPPPPKDPFNKHLQMAAITDDEDGVRVGLFNNNTKLSFFLVIGETTEDGITLVNADYEGGGALLRKGDEEYWMYMDGRSSKGPTHTEAPKPAPVPAEAVKTPVAKIVKPMSYVDRLKMRRETTQKEEEKKIEAAAEAVASKKIEAIDRNELLRKYNLELIRAKGAKGTPLPIQLTPEEDAMLVKEGVLPPQQ